MTLSTPGSLDNANYIPTDIPCTQIPKIIQQVTLYTTLTILNINYCSTIIYDTKLNFIMIIKSISLFRRFVLNYKFHHNANFKKDYILQKRNHPLILRIFHSNFFYFFTTFKNQFDKILRGVGKNPNRHTLTITAGDTVIEQQASFSQPFPSFIVRRSASLRYSFRLFLYFRLPNGAAAKQRGRTPGAGVTCTGSFVSALLFLRAHHPISPSLPSPTVFRPSITFHSSCMVLATSSNHWVPRRDKKENGTRPEEGARRRRKEGERRSHDLCVNGVLARKSL